MLSGVAVAVAAAEEHLLAEHVPGLRGRGEAVGQPLLLRRARAASASGSSAGGQSLYAVTAGLVVAVLPGVEHVEVRELAPLEPAVELDVGSGGTEARRSGMFS